MEDAAEGVEVGGGQRIGEEVAGDAVLGIGVNDGGEVKAADLEMRPTGDSGGDPVSLAAYLFGLSQADACRKLATMLGIAQ